jgi:MFS family permease
VTVLLTAVANWFRRKMGMASGIAICGFGFSGVLIPVIVKLIAVYDWRTTLHILALGMVVLILPLSFIFRHRPEQYGYFPDGQKQETTAPFANSSPSQSLEVELRVKQALKNGTFWRLALARLYHIMTMMAITTHVMPYLSSLGFSRSTSSLVATAIPLISILGRLGFGWFGDKFNKRSVAATSFIMMSCGVFCFAYTSDMRGWLLAPFLILLGIGYGGTNAILPALGREYFGRTKFGSIYGLMEGIGTIGAIIGPTLAGWAYDSLGSYQIIWLLMASLAVAAIALVFTVTPASNVIKLDDPAAA